MRDVGYLARNAWMSDRFVLYYYCIMYRGVLLLYGMTVFERDLGRAMPTLAIRMLRSVDDGESAVTFHYHSLENPWFIRIKYLYPRVLRA
jgi:hypothetical protein